MSGFGSAGGFGSSGFGGMPSNSQGGGGGQGFGGGFGSSVPPQPPYQPPSFGGFGGSPLAPPPAAFGSSPNVVVPPAGFGGVPAQSSGGAFGGAPSSGFGGGGFGSSTVVQSAPSTFGTSSSSTTFASGFEKSPLSVGFGSSNTGAFGAAPAAPPTQFGGGPATGFGSSDIIAGGSFASATPSNGFGSATPSNGFGSAPPSNSFGSAPVSGGFGNAPVSGGFGGAPVSGGFGTGPASGFGSAPVSGGFGTAPALGGFGSAPASGGFGSAPSSSGFGSAPASRGFTSFGSNTPAPASACGSSSNAASSGLSGGFGDGALATTTSGFGSSGPTSSGFGSTPSSGITFGASSNVMTRTSSIPPTASRFVLPNSESSWGWTPDTASSHSNPFGSGPSGMRASNDVDTNDDGGMMDGGVASSTAHFMTGAQRDGRNNLTFRPNYISNTAISPVPETGMGDANDDLEADDRRKAEANLKIRIEEKKRLLQAKLEEKRRKLLEKQSERTGNSPIPPDDPIVSSRVSKTKNDSQSLAERNALRFGDQPKSLGNSMLPVEMRSKAKTGQQLRVASPETTSTFDQQTATVREDLRTAKALVGTCKFFCPDEELHRREGENDIQQLETPMPGKLHPANWTLRNTVIKRFRRSAADYKLDVPEWVRPPDVLEQVCGYLEEWVMERDRQGPDPRFPQGQTPPPLEVYQFIWDRTRMIRKDFTLQNYVGTGGQCDARAVRCHERIARWHAMCEHQLSHIPDFVTMQSQQNIQELGQTMKTLNQFYDDSLRRATIEVPNEHGKETRSDLSGFAHGCSSNHVRGNPPVEYDGSNLDNSTTNPRITQRIMGKHAVNFPSRGTAEPEMRGIYMLLTMNNEGGMEVLKYAAKLFEDRPEIYHSRPVQLSLDIFKAKKELNYARFFSILRDPATPYLFCCIMFKHVELMRKVAFRIMNKSFGGWRKKDGEGVQGVDDTYPLSHLVHLLCFEDLSEARAACEHYGITVRRLPTSTSDELSDVIQWKASQFGEPVHPEKKYVIPLPPWKMNRTIERKLDGATRLAVCRGQASGEGATIQHIPAIAVSHYAIHNPVPLSDEKATAAVLQRQQQLEAVRQDEEQRRELKNQEEQRRAAERKKEEEERVREEARKAEEEEKRHARKVQLAKEKEEESKRQEEKRRVAAEMRAQEEAHRRKQEAAAKRKAEEDYQIAEEKRKREEEAHRVAEAEARRQREQQQRTLEEQHRIQEARRQEHLRLEAERKRILEAEERRQAQEWEDKVIAAKKILIWHRWKNRIARTIETTYGSSMSLHRLDPTFGSRSFELQPLYHRGREFPRFDTNVGDGGRSVDIRRAIEACNRNVSLRLSLSRMALDEVVSSQPIDESRQALLMKVALLIPHSIDNDCKKMGDLLLSWFDARVGVDKVDSSHLSVSGCQCTIRTRSIVHLCRTVDDCIDCDVALIVVPPPWSTNHQRRKNLCSLASMLDDSMPRTALVLGDFDHAGYDDLKSFLAETLGPKDGSLKITCNRAVTPEAIESALKAACRSISSTFVNDSCVEIDRRTVAAVASEAISAYLWGKLSAHDASDVNVVLECARSAISTLVAETEEVLTVNDEIWSSWPPKDFVSRDGVQGYFSDGSSLPANWRSSLSRETFGESLSLIRNRLTGSFRDVVESLLFEAPAQIRDDCSLLVAKGFYRRSLQLAMEGFAEYGDTSEGRFAYFPRGTLKVILDKLSKTAGCFHAESIPRLILPISDSALVDITPKTNEGILKESWVPMHTTLPPEIMSTPKRNKRRLSGERPSSESYDSVASVSGEPKRARGVDIMKSSRDIDDSAALTRKMHELVNGGTVDLVIGDSSLSRILRGVPTIDTNGG